MRGSERCHTRLHRSAKYRYCEDVWKYLKLFFCRARPQLKTLLTQQYEINVVWSDGVGLGLDLIYQKNGKNGVHKLQFILIYQYIVHLVKCYILLNKANDLALIQDPVDYSLQTSASDECLSAVSQILCSYLLDVLYFQQRACLSTRRRRFVKSPLNRDALRGKNQTTFA